MAFEEKKRCLWHAFNALDDHRTGMGSKSRLKVLTHNIATSLGIEKTEEALQDYRSADSISFLDYIYFLQVEVFSQVKHQDTVNANVDLEEVDRVCWLVSSKRYLDRKQGVLSNESAYRLWRIFNFLAESDSGGSLIYPMCMDSEEVGVLVGRIIQPLGKHIDEDEFAEICKEIPRFNYEQVLNLIETRYSEGVTKAEMEATILEVYEEYIVQVFKKGYVQKKGHKVTGCKERWFVLTPSRLQYFTTSDEKDLKGEVPITANCRVEGSAEKPGTKHHWFHLVSEGKTYEISVADRKTKNEWLAAFRSAIDYCRKPESSIKHAVNRRKTVREQKREKDEEEERRRLEEIKKLETQKQMLAKEKEAREALEAKLEEEANLRKAEHQRLEELQEMQKELERLLEEERQAKRDEELVRGAQARLIAEEMEKREQLEQLQVEQEALLEQERQKREGLEEEQQHQLELLEEERKRLEALESERKALDDKLQGALTALTKAEKARAEQEARTKRQKELAGNISYVPKFISHRGKGAFSDAEMPPAKPFGQNKENEQNKQNTQE